MVDSMKMVGLTKEVVASNSIKEGDVDFKVVMKVSVEKEGVGGAHDEGTANDEEFQYNTYQKEKSKLFSQKEKRKMDLGQASKGKNYVEEETRLLRDSVVYFDFDV
ncbi:uncharacterized protein A4U43_C07F7870 [Asparagus officinalis]|uniref:Uncharacterized protein n=1 Tax=Asparagus officinalis TaxID=4686 RepID=A0A5P1EA79_ASPOF|nr:uncharacterized protein A4U43_C07F7870 [Asparagus officinalis]